MMMIMEINNIPHADHLIIDVRLSVSTLYKLLLLIALVTMIGR